MNEKDLLQIKIETLQAKVNLFEKKYKMTFTEFEHSCKDGKIENPFSYLVEKDNWEWEATITELEDLTKIKEVQRKIYSFEEKYKMKFSEFEKAWKEGNIKKPFSYEIEKDYMQWETAVFELSKFLRENINQ